jgi:hypothetical protein
LQHPYLGIATPSHTSVCCSKQSHRAIAVELLGLVTKKGVQTMHRTASKQTIEATIIDQHESHLPKLLADVGKKTTTPNEQHKFGREFVGTWLPTTGQLTGHCSLHQK